MHNSKTSENGSTEIWPVYIDETGKIFVLPVRVQYVPRMAPQVKAINVANLNDISITQQNFKLTNLISFVHFVFVECMRLMNKKFSCLNIWKFGNKMQGWILWKTDGNLFI